MGLNKRLTVLQTLFGFDGRVGRLRFLGFNLLIGVLLLPNFILTVAFAQEIAERKSSFGGLAAVVVFPWLFTFWPGIALMVKRLHDIGRSGFHALWICAVWYVPSSGLSSGLTIALQIVAVVASFGLLFWPGTRGPNDYGLQSGKTVDRTSGNVAKAAL